MNLNIACMRLRTIHILSESESKARILRYIPMSVEVSQHFLIRIIDIWPGLKRKSSIHIEKTMTKGASRDRQVYPYISYNERYQHDLLFTYDGKLCL